MKVKSDVFEIQIEEINLVLPKWDGGLWDGGFDRQYPQRTLLLALRRLAW